MHMANVYNPHAAILGSSIRQSGRLLTARFQVRVLAEEPDRKKQGYWQGFRPLNTPDFILTWCPQK
jgi:hypothetical protein